jgi:MFS family permease
VLWPAGLALVVATLWCVATGRTSLEAWRVPVEYSDDALFTLGTLRAAQQGDLTPLGLVTVPALGAPYQASWNDFIRQHKLQYVLAGAAARALGLFPAANLLVLLAAILAALSFFAVSRKTGARPEWALAGGAAFALSPFFFFRSLTHLTLANDWPIPLAILAVSWAFGRRGLVPGTRRLRVAAMIAIVAGFHNIYFAGLFAQFLGFACLAQGLLRRCWRAALGALALLALLLGAVIADNSNNLLQRFREGPTQAFARPYGNIERYALKPIELVIPTAEGSIVPWRAAGISYVRQALVRGEIGSMYLGLAGLAALAALAFVTARATLARPRRPVPIAALAVAWILGYSVVGGVNGLLGLMGFVWLRAGGRNGVWIHALVLLWAASAISRSALVRRRGASVAAAALVGVLTLADQLPSPRSLASIRDQGAHVASDAALVRSLETTLPAGAMLFQLPVVDYPEGQRLQSSGDYEPLRPYLHAERLRFSYGSDKGRPREAWQRRVEKLEPAAMVSALERIGFGGVLLNRKAYADGGGELRDALAEAGRNVAWESTDHDFLFVRLQPAATTEPPERVAPPEPGGAGR